MFPLFLKKMVKGCFLLILVLLSSHCYSQEYKEGSKVQMLVHKLVISEGGTLKEALSLTQEWMENVIRKNENFENVQLLISDTSKDTIDLFVLYQYKESITENVEDIDLNLIKAYWQEKADFDRFMGYWQEYINPLENKKNVLRKLVLEK